MATLATSYRLIPLPVAGPIGTSGFLDTSPLTYHSGPERNMTELEFKSLAAQGYNRIPLLAEAFADLETPLTLYLKLAQTQNQGKNTFLLESVVGGERFGRYSFIGLPANTLLRSQGQRTEVVQHGEVIETFTGNALDFIAEFQSRYKVALSPGMPRFCGGPPPGKPLGR